jgi:hypothetical protein
VRKAGLPASQKLSDGGPVWLAHTRPVNEEKVMEQTHLRIATSTGPAHWALIFHAGAGTIGLITGFIALAVAKGGRTHRLMGRIFVYAMIAMGFMAASIAAYEGKASMVIGGLFTAYLIFTAMTTVRPVPDEPRGLGVGLGVLALAFGAAEVIMGVGAAGSPTGMKDGVPFPMYFFMGSIALLAGAGDLRMIRAGGVRGAQRIARHLWRMCFGLFIASGSFFLGQMRFFPAPLRIPALLAVPALLPLVALLYWLWRVRFRRSLRGLVTAAPSTT